MKIKEDGTICGTLDEFCAVHKIRINTEPVSDGVACDLDGWVAENPAIYDVGSGKDKKSAMLDLAKKISGENIYCVLGPFLKELKAWDFVEEAETGKETRPVKEVMSNSSKLRLCAKCDVQLQGESYMHEGFEMCKKCYWLENPPVPVRGFDDILDRANEKLVKKLLRIYVSSSEKDKICDVYNTEQKFEYSRLVK